MIVVLLLGRQANVASAAALVTAAFVGRLMLEYGALQPIGALIGAYFSRIVSAVPALASFREELAAEAYALARLDG
jgi:hypothetical protein